MVCNLSFHLLSFFFVTVNLHLPPPSFCGHPPFIPGRRRDPGNQRREHQGNEACARHRAHQEWWAPRPPGAQEGRRLGARIWWVNLRKHSLLPNLHAVIQGERLLDGRWREELNFNPRTLHPSLDTSSWEGGGGGGRGGWFLVVVSKVRRGGLLVPSPPPAPTCTEFSCHSHVSPSGH